MTSLNYTPDGAILKEFMKDESFVRLIRGPVGSGKSVACCIELFRRALQQAPNAEGLRKTRWAVIRNTNPQLKTTTIKTWLDWFPENEWGKFNHSPPYSHRIRKGDIDCEVIFLALDTPEDVKKLLSLELTGAFINEAREVPKAIVDAVTMRVGRFPSMKDGGPTWYGVICDTNAPAEDHWWPIMAGEVPVPDHVSIEERLTLVKPDGWTFFNQPPGMLEVSDSQGGITGYVLNPDRENGKNLTPDYYPKIIQGKGRQWIKVYVLNRLATLNEGKPVYPTFRTDVHVAREPIELSVHVPLQCGIDFGLTPSAVFGQEVGGRWLILAELVAENMGAQRFASVMKNFIARKWPGLEMSKIIFTGDPAGDHRAQTDETTPFMIFRKEGIRAVPAWTNDPVMRVEAVEATLNRLVNGQPGFLLDPSCINLKAGFEGGYNYRRLQVSGSERHDDRPEKNRYSHPHDALQYLMIRGGEGRKVVSAEQPASAKIAKRSWSVWDRQKKPRSRRNGWALR